MHLREITEKSYYMISFKLLYPSNDDDGSKYMQNWESSFQEGMLVIND